MIRCLYGFAFALVACGGGGTTDPCDGATSGTMCRWAGTGQVGFNTTTPNANRLDSQLDEPADLTFGPDNRAYIADWNNHQIRRVELDQRLVTIMGTDYEGDGPDDQSDRLPECAPAGALGPTIALNHPTDVKFGPDGLLYVSAWHNNKIRVMDTNSLMTTVVAGNGYGFAGDSGPACQALFNQPKTTAFGDDGMLYTIDQRNVRIRRIAMAGDKSIDTIAGVGTPGGFGDGGPAFMAQLGMDTGTTPRPTGGLVMDGRIMYLADSLNNRIRRINLDTGIIDCIGNTASVAGYTGDGGPAVDATFNLPNDLEMGPDHRLYISDRYNNAVRVIDLTTGIVDTFAGGTECDGERDPSACPDSGEKKAMGLFEPYGISFDNNGDLYIVDTRNSRIMRVVK